LISEPPDEEASRTTGAGIDSKGDGGEPASSEQLGFWDDHGTAEDIILFRPRPAIVDDNNAGDDETSGMPGEDDTDPMDDQVPTAIPPQDPAAEAPERAPTVTGKPMPELPRRGDIASLGVNTPGVAPKRIGSGRLVPARLTWKPGDPFAGTKRSPAEQFRWEVMLTSACVTAACGLGCIWLLRTILV
jgi:hypothetical protein